MMIYIVKMRRMVANLQTMQKRRLTHSLSLTLGFLCICIWICKSDICIWICIWICKSSSMKGLRVVQGFCESGQKKSNKFQKKFQNNQEPGQKVRLALCPTRPS